MVGSDRARSSAVEVGLARPDAPTDRAVDLDRLDPTIGGELESTVQMGVRVDPHRRAGSDVLHEDLVRRVLVNPHATILEEDRKLLAVVLEPHCCCGLYHVAPPFMVS